jgi:hypothetical protein
VLLPVEDELRELEQQKVAGKEPSKMYLHHVSYYQSLLIGA